MALFSIAADANRVFTAMSANVAASVVVESLLPRYTAQENVIWKFLFGTLGYTGAYMGAFDLATVLIPLYEFSPLYALVVLGPFMLPNTLQRLQDVSREIALEVKKAVSHIMPLPHTPPVPVDPETGGEGEGDSEGEGEDEGSDPIVDKDPVFRWSAVSYAECLSTPNCPNLYYESHTAPNKTHGDPVGSGWVLVPTLKYAGRIWKREVTTDDPERAAYYVLDRDLNNNLPLGTVQYATSTGYETGQMLWVTDTFPGAVS